MKTFRLMSLEIVQNKEGIVRQESIPFIDGLIINQENDENDWIIEAYLEEAYTKQINTLFNNNEDFIVLVRITHERNTKATFITSVFSINVAGEHVNVILNAHLVDNKKHILVDILQSLIEKGYDGDTLLEEFKKRI